MKTRRVHGWIPYYRAPANPAKPKHENANTISLTWARLLAEYGMRMGDTICGLPEKRRVVSRFNNDYVTCPQCRTLVAAMIVRAFRVLVGLPVLEDRLWGYTCGPEKT